MITLSPSGMHCAKGRFHVDPWRNCDEALITHAHSDHARIGAKLYHCTPGTAALIALRLGSVSIQTHEFGEKFKMHDTWVSFHPAGHILGSSQVRVENRDEVWVFSGDYKRDADPSCEPWETVECGTFITEATFALPIYVWEPTKVVVRDIFEWWQADRESCSILFGYSLGKSQRVLAALTEFTDRPVYVHGAVAKLTEIYRSHGVKMVPTRTLAEGEGAKLKGELILAPPSAHRSPWMKRFPNPQTAFASGWMQVRGQRRRHGYERGFVLSDHVDWPGLLQTIEETKAKNILITHGQSAVLGRYLNGKGWTASELQTEFAAEGEA